MTPEQRAKLQALLPGMRKMARRKVSQNDFRKAFNDVVGLEVFLNGGESERTAEEWLVVAEKAAEGHDKPGVIKGMTMEQIRSGKPPEAFL